MFFDVFAHVVSEGRPTVTNLKFKIAKNHVLHLVSNICERCMLVNPIGFRPSMICADQVFDLQHMLEYIRTFRGLTVPVFVVLGARST